MVELRKTNFIGEVPVIDRLGGKNDGKVLGTAKLEKTKGGAIIAHIDMRDHSPEHLLRGFSLGDISIADDQ